MLWNDNGTITVDPPKRPKKITGTRLAAIMGYNPYKTPFAIWCEVTKTYEDPFVDNKYTLAGKAIEPKQAQFIRDHLGLMVIAPSDVYGDDYFKTTGGDFFKDQKVLGGMWDFLLEERGERTGVIEMKTTKWENFVKWKAEGLPLYYVLQVAEYAYLYGLDECHLLCTGLHEEDYEHPEELPVSYENTFVESFRVSEKFPNMSEIVKYAYDWWDAYVVTGNSPPYDEKKDAEILKVLRRNNVNPETDIKALIDEAETLQLEIDAIKESIGEKEERLKTLKSMIKDYSKKCFRDGDKQVEFRGGKYIWTISKIPSTSIDKEAMEKDGVLDKYTLNSETLKLTNKEVADVH